MKEYVITLIGTVIICSLASMLAPEEKGMLGYVKLAAGLCVLCVAISPLASFAREALEFDVGRSFLDGDDESENLNGIYEGSLLGASETSVSEGLRVMICREFGLDSDEIEVSVTLSGEGEEYKPSRATVVLGSGKAIFADPHEIADYVTALLGCSCEIIYGDMR